MKYLQYIMMGFALGVIHGLILLAAKTTFSSVLIPMPKTSLIGMAPTYITAFTPGEIIYNSLIVTGVADLAIIVTVISAVWWIPKLERICLGD